VVSDVRAQAARIKRSTPLPVVVGFGVRTPEQARVIADCADGVVVGSALVETIRTTLGPDGKAGPDTISAVHRIVRSLTAGLRSATARV
jgi:tryptophan synthase alpha chain